MPCFDSSLTSGQSCSVVANAAGSTQTNVSYAIRNNGNGTLNLTGNATGSNNVGVINNSSGGTFNITGNVTANTGTQTAARNTGSGTMVITGTVSCLNATAAAPNASGAGAGASNESTGTLQIVGTIQAGTAPGVTGGTSGQAILTGPFLTSANGVAPVKCGRWFWQNTTPPATYYQIRSANLAVVRPLYTADSVGGNPAVTNVRSGTVYGPNDELTGTLAVPPAGSVALGVPVDNTTGTAAIDGASIRSALGLASANLDTQLDALPTAAEAATAVRSELSTELGRIDVATSTRLAPDGTLATVTTLTNAPDVPTPEEIAAEVWSTTTREITGGTVDTLTSAPDVPTPEQVAAEVRTELSAELAHLDADVSSRLAPADTLARVTLVDTVTTLTNAPDVPTAEEIAVEVRSELTPELERVANCATVETTGDQIAALS